MTERLDLGPTAQRMAALIRTIGDDQLDSAGGPSQTTGCGDLVDHVGGFAIAFVAAATKDTADTGSGWRLR